VESSLLCIDATLARHESLTMDHENYGSDPFTSEGMWRISKFTLDSLQPIEPLPWNENLNLPGTFELAAARSELILFYSPLRRHL
jgi:hypothetical protein